MNITLNIIICDNDYIFLKKLHNQISDILSINNYKYEITELYDGTELVKYCEKNVADIVLADIDMPGMNGFNAISELHKQQPNLPVVFVTAHEELAFQAYDYNPFWFVSKFSIEKLNAVLLRLAEKIEYKNTFNKQVLIKADKVISLNVEQITYLKSNGHYLTACTPHSETHKFRCNIQQAYTQLKEYGFIYAQRSYIVNCRYIDIINSRNIILTTKEKISMSRNKDISEAAQALYRQFLRRSRW